MALNDADLFLVNQGGESKKITYANLKSNIGAGASVSVGENPPANPEEGDLWWDSSDDSGRLYVWYEDTNTNQWVEASPSGSGGGGDGDTVIVNSGGADAWVLSTGAGVVWNSFNVDRVDRLSTGTFRVYFTNPMPSNDYSVQCTIAEEQYSVVAYNTDRTQEYFTVKILNQDGTFFDFNFSVAVFATDGNSGGYWMEDGGALKPTNSANRVQVGGDRDTDAAGASFETYGLVRAARPSTQVNPNIASVFEGWLGTNATSNIFADGSAKFAGDVTVNKLIANLPNGTGVGFEINSDQRYISLSSNGSATFAAGNILFSQDGSASFSGRITGGDGTKDQYGLSVYNKSAINSSIYARNYENTGFVFEAWNASLRTSSIKADGSAVFKGGVTQRNSLLMLDADNPANFNVEGEYTGPTLDVKDRIQNLLSRIDAIEANEVIDDATDTSLLQLVANASARLDSIEARLTALEGGNN